MLFNFGYFFYQTMQFVQFFLALLLSFSLESIAIKIVLPSLLKTFSSRSFNFSKKTWSVYFRGVCEFSGNLMSECQGSPSCAKQNNLCWYLIRYVHIPVLTWSSRYPVTKHIIYQSKAISWQFNTLSLNPTHFCHFTCIITAITTLWDRSAFLPHPLCNTDIYTELEGPWTENSLLLSKCTIASKR